MNNLKPSLKFNRKVYVIPAEKLTSLLEMERDAKEQQNQDTSMKSHEDGMETHDTISMSKNDVKGPQDSQKNSSTQQQEAYQKFKHAMTAEQFSNAMAIGHMLGFHPEIDEKHRQALLFTQNVTPTAPVPDDVVTLYHLIDNAKVPKHLITNMKMREALRRMADLPEYESSDDASQTDYENEDDILRRAWVYYVNDQDRKRKSDNKRKDKKAKNKKCQSCRKQDKKANKKDKSTTGQSDAVAPPSSVGSSKGTSAEWVHLF
jgi:hypothetical protein